MIPRAARVVAVDVPHHITHRGNNRQDVFLTDEDRRRYQHLLAFHLDDCRADLLGWCWMSNHVHLIVVPHAGDSLARLIRRVHSGYAQDFNRRRSRDGHLWRSRFFSCALGPAHLAEALLYVDLNPVRAGMTGRAMDWEWSSARAHAEGRDETGLLNRRALEIWGGCADWAERLRVAQEVSTAAAIRRATRLGKPFGDEEFQRDWERRVSAERRQIEPEGGSRPAARAARAGGR